MTSASTFHGENWSAKIVVNPTLAVHIFDGGKFFRSERVTNELVTRFELQKELAQAEHELLAPLANINCTKVDIDTP